MKNGKSLEVALICILVLAFTVLCVALAKTV